MTSPEPGKPLSETEHTPTPWQIDGAAVLDSSGEQLIGDCSADLVHGCWAESYSNAAFIVKAVNAYDDNQKTITQQAAQIRAYGNELEKIAAMDLYGYDFARVDEVLKQFPLSAESGREEDK